MSQIKIRTKISLCGTSKFFLSSHHLFLSPKQSLHYLKISCPVIEVLASNMMVALLKNFSLLGILSHKLEIGRSSKTLFGELLVEVLISRLASEYFTQGWTIWCHFAICLFAICQFPTVDSPYELVRHMPIRHTMCARARRNARAHANIANLT